MSALARAAEKALAEAVARGEFDDFAGKGQPLDASQWGDPTEGEWAMAFRLLRQADMAPRWIELDKEIRRRKAELRSWLRSRLLRDGEANGPSLQLQSRVEGEISAINQLVEVRNYLAPAVILPAFFMNVEDEMEAAIK
jgi:hypothetical protein